jgi:uroporphyrin-III C-methyltransferase/precorrin-2 dehydrogenase/sirohydrochlorin ferrochelatase
VLVVGGEIALRKSRLLADAGALLRVVAPEIEAQLRELVTGSGVNVAWLCGSGPGRLRLIIAATDDEPLNAQVSSDAHRVACRSMWWTRRSCAA